jgi:hypothetical protein
MCHLFTRRLNRDRWWVEQLTCSAPHPRQLALQAFAPYPLISTESLSWLSSLTRKHAGRA